MILFGGFLTCTGEGVLSNYYQYFFGGSLIDAYR